MSTPTGHLLYAWNEKYVSAADVDEHMKIGDAKWDQFPKLLKLVKTNGHFMIAGHGKIVANYNDCSEPCTARKGDTTVSLGLVVPGRLERDVDAAWRQHERWMRKTVRVNQANPDPRQIQIQIQKTKKSKKTHQLFPIIAARLRRGRPRQVRRPDPPQDHPVHRHQGVRARRPDGPALRKDRQRHVRG